MNRIGRIAVCAAAALTMAGGARAQVTLNSVRVGATDTAALAKFYEAAFGLHEVNRLQTAAGPEIFLNFGASADAAKANQSPRIVLMHRDSDAVKDPVPHVIFTVTDVKATAAAVKAAGGSMEGEPRAFGNTGIIIGMAADPAGNRIDMIQRP